jgi:hypothetical protein
MRRFSAHAATQRQYDSVVWKHDLLLIILLVLLVLLETGLGDSVQVTLTALGHPTASLVFVLLYNANLLESLQHFAINRAWSILVVIGTRSAVLGCAVDFSEPANADGLAKIYVTLVLVSKTRMHGCFIWQWHNTYSYGSGADIEPVGILGRKFPRVAGFDGIDPGGDWQSALTLQELSWIILVSDWRRQQRRWCWNEQ